MVDRTIAISQSSHHNTEICKEMLTKRLQALEDFYTAVIRHYGLDQLHIKHGSGYLQFILYLILYQLQMLILSNNTYNIGTLIFVICLLSVVQ